MKQLLDLLCFYWMNLVYVCVECKDGQFESDCSKTCNCLDAAVCNKFNGSCSVGCAIGYMGHNCQKGWLRLLQLELL